MKLSSLIFLWALHKSNAAVDPERELTVTTAGPNVCTMDYTLIATHGDTAAPYPPITILEQNGDTVKFKVHQVWTPFDADSIFVEYSGPGLGEYDCDEYQNVGEEEDITVTAHCLHLNQVTIVDIFVVDNAVNGNANVPACCHNGNPPTVDTVKYTYELQCTPTCPEPHTDPECPVVTMDFNQFPDYSYVHDDYWYTMGVKITGQGKDGKGYTPLPKDAFPIGSAWEDRYGFTENNPNQYSDDTWQDLDNSAGGAVRVFNTNKPDGLRGNPKCDDTDGDTDLGSPHDSCPSSTPGAKSSGPGFGNGGHRSKTWSNCPTPMLGNVLVIQESRKSCPDDSADGGWIIFDFNPNIAGDVEFRFAKILDTDESNTPQIKVWKTGEDTTKEPDTAVYTTPKTGDNGLWYNDFYSNNTWRNRYKDIKRIAFQYHGSGSVAEIQYKPSKCPPA